MLKVKFSKNIVLRLANEGCSYLARCLLNGVYMIRNKLDRKFDIVVRGQGQTYSKFDFMARVTSPSEDVVMAQLLLFDG